MRPIFAMWRLIAIPPAADQRRSKLRVDQSPLPPRPPGNGHARGVAKPRACRIARSRSIGRRA